MPDRSSFLSDTYPMPVFGFLDRRHIGPCYDTCLGLVERGSLPFCAMKRRRPRYLALETLNRLNRNPGFSDRFLEEVFERNPRLSERDRAFTFHLVQGVLRWRLRLDWIIGSGVHFPFHKIEPTILNILRIAVYQVFFMDRVPDWAAVNEAVNQAKEFGQSHVVSFVNGILRRLCSNKAEISFPSPERDRVKYLSVFYSYPPWLVRKWIRELGSEPGEALLEAQNCVPDLIIRANALKTDREELIKRLKEEGVNGVPTRYAPEGIRVLDLKGPVKKLSTFREGLFQVQGEGAQVCSHLLSPEPGESILDLCAGLGGKATLMAELTGNETNISAVDLRHGRLRALMENSLRLGIHGIQGIVVDASGSLSNCIRQTFDKIIIDGPCSALGVLSKHPDGKWRREESDVKRLSRLQQDLLESASPLLREGGKMLYVTCTISQEENEGVIGRFLEKHKEMELENLKGDAPHWAQELIDDRGFLKTLPHVHGMEGFFGALMSKK